MKPKVSLARDVRRLIEARFFDPSRFCRLDWSALSRRPHYEEINDVLAGLHDRYTCIKSIDVFEAEQAAGINGCVHCGVGIAFLAQMDEERFARRDANDRMLPVYSLHGYPVIWQVHSGSSAASAGILPGDALVAINGEGAKGMTYDDVVAKTLGCDGEIISAEVRSRLTSKTCAFQLTCRSIFIPTVFGKSLGEWGYIRITDFRIGETESELAKIIALLSSTRGWVVDLRFNEGGDLYTWLKAACVLLPPGRQIARIMERKEGRLLQTVQVTSGGVLNPGRLFETERLTMPKPTVVLVNRDTACSAELLAGALAYNGAIMLGDGYTTFGKGVARESVYLREHQAVLTITDSWTITPDGRWPGDGNDMRFGLQSDRHKAGDHTIPPGADGDVQLAYALELLEHWDTESQELA